MLHEKIGEKLQEMDELLTRIITSIDNNTMLIVMGDHGMTREGNHGGSSQDETDTVIFGYYKNGFLKYKLPELEPIMRFDPEYKKKVSQLDLAPTLSMLLGIPIPFNNIGFIINDFYVSRGLSLIEELPQILHDNYQNILQINRYISEMQTQYQRYSFEVHQYFSRKIAEIQLKVKEIYSVGLESIQLSDAFDVLNLMKEASSYIYDVTRSMISFDFDLMIGGLLSQFLFILFNYAWKFLIITSVFPMSVL